MHEALGVNEKLTVLLARTTFSAAAIEEVGLMLQRPLDWYAVLNACIRNKTLALAWRNLKELKLTKNVPKKIREVGAFYAAGVAQKNAALFSQFHEVSNALKASGIRFAPLKGLVLVNEIYTMDSRQMADFDLMISKDDCRRVRHTLNSLGFVEGEYDSTSRSVRPIDRHKKVLWSLYMYNLPPFIKVLDNQYLDTVEVDFTFDIRFESKQSAADAFLSRASYYAPLNCDALMPEEFLIHLCCHLYKEAKNILWVEMEVDFNLIKFCDVREYTMRVLPSLDLDRFVSLARQYEVEEAIYFTFYFLSEIYQDGYERSILLRFPKVDASTLHSYGERDLGAGISIDGGFWRRFFKTDYLPAESKKSTYSSLI